MKVIIENTKIDLKIYQETYMWERRLTKKLTCERGMAKMNYEPSFNDTCFSNNGYSSIMD